MLRALPYIVLSIIVYLILFYMQNYQSALLSDIIIKIDVLEISASARNEHHRLYDIDQLSIPYEQKQVLINRTVFIGCSSDMVKLALGEPKKVVVDSAAAKTYFVYYLPGDKRPTILVLDKDQLVNAYKGSALDLR